MTSRLLKKFFQWFNYPVSMKRYWTASVSNTNKAVILKHAKSGEELLFPAVWLRDNCLCSSCFNKNIHSRLIKSNEFQFLIQPKSVSVSCFFLKLQNFFIMLDRDKINIIDVNSYIRHSKRNFYTFFFPYGNTS